VAPDRPGASDKSRSVSHRFWCATCNAAVEPWPSEAGSSSRDQRTPPNDHRPNDRSATFQAPYAGLALGARHHQFRRPSRRNRRSAPTRCSGLSSRSVSCRPAVSAGSGGCSTELPIYFCLYKIHTYQGNLDEAQAAAESGLEEAASQAGWDPDWREWRPQAVLPEGAGRFALYTLKALAFIHLRQDNPHQASQILERLRQLDPTGAVGWPVVAALAEGVG